MTLRADGGEALADSIFSQVGGVLDVKLFHNVSSMMIHSSYAYEKKIRNLLVRFAFGNEFQDFFFS